MIFNVFKEKARHGNLTLLLIKTGGFRSMKEDVVPMGIAGMLEKYAGLCRESVESHGGAVYRVEGDRITALWEDESGSKTAPLSCALEIAEKLRNPAPEIQNIFKDRFRFFLSLGRGPCVFAKKGDDFVYLVGDILAIVKKLYDPSRFGMDRIAVDPSLAQAFPHDPRLIPAEGEEGLFFLTQA